MRIVKTELTTTIGLNSMFSWTKNWQRTKTEKYTKTHTTGRSWSITCPAKCYCDREIVVHSYQVKSEYYYKVTTVSVSVLLFGEKVSTMQYRYHSLITLSFLSCSSLHHYSHFSWQRQAMCRKRYHDRKTVIWSQNRRRRL